MIKLSYTAFLINNIQQKSYLNLWLENTAEMIFEIIAQLRYKG